MRRNASGVLALVGLGIYYAWRNRFQIQRFLESQGVNTKIDTSNVGNALRSGAAKVRGKIDHGQREVKRDFDRDEDFIDRKIG